MIEACPECDLLQQVPRLKPKQCVFCCRCGHAFSELQPYNASQDAAIAVTTLILLGIANYFPILTLELDGLRRDATVFDGVLSMWTQQRYELASIIFAVAIALPIANAMSVLARSYLAGHPQRRRSARHWALAAARLAPWGMTEVYLLGALVAFVKLDELAGVVVGPALYAFALMSILTAWSATHSTTIWSALGADLKR